MDNYSEDNEDKIRICFLGKVKVGKTCIIHQFIRNVFRENYIPTI